MDRLDIGNENLLSLDGAQYFRIRDHLDISTSPDHGWRAIVSCLDGDYELSHEEVQKIAHSPSPTEALMMKLDSRGMTIDEFISYAVRAEDVILIRFFDVRVAARITEHPTPEILCLEGDTLTLSVRAIGHPAPQYRWCKDGTWIPNASHRHYELTDLRLEDGGLYRCAIIQGNDHTQVQFSNPSLVTIGEVPDMEIKQHPRNQPAHVGSNALLSCEVWGPRGMQYQWFKGATPLEDGPRFKGSNTNELSLYNIDKEMLGCYHCQISLGKKVLETKGAAVQIAELLTQSDKNYTASDKVALLLGCGDYRGDKILKAPYNDVKTLTNIFESLNFRVVSLLNLSRKEMIAAVHEFRELVGPGVYCVFYFCGHGFEVSNQVYLVPCDVPQGYTYVNCVSADRICNFLLGREPKLMCMILDVCRKPQDTLPQSVGFREPVKMGNTIVVYGTSYGLSAYEDEHHGIMVSHLKNFLSLPYCVETVFQNFKHAIHNDPKLSKNASKKQIPQVNNNLSESRSFADPIVYTGFTEVFTRRRHIWETAHRVPAPRFVNVEFPGFTVKVQLDFQQVCSNVLNIYTTVVDPGHSTRCTAWVCGIPMSIAEKAKVIIRPSWGSDGVFNSRVKLHNVHRLKGDMNINIEVNCKDLDLRKIQPVADLGLPLVSVLRLWEERPDFTQPRKPQEVEEEDGDSNLEEDLRRHAQGLFISS